MKNNPFIVILFLVLGFIAGFAVSKEFEKKEITESNIIGGDTIRLIPAPGVSVPILPDPNIEQIEITLNPILISKYGFSWEREGDMFFGINEIVNGYEMEASYQGKSITHILSKSELHEYKRRAVDALSVKEVQTIYITP